jgi:predicted GTPase
MSNNPLQNLKMLFQNRPEVLRMLDARELDLAGLESAAYIREQKKRKLYPEPVNFYATGRTGAGKTSLGNTLLDTGTGKPPMESHGHQDCTSSVQYFQLASNLRYYDLPGAGSNEDFENINRAALVIEQITDEDEEISPVSQLKILDFSEYETKGVQEEVVGVDNWQSSNNQKFVGADIILYVVAPHMLFIGDDKRYLRGLLKSQTQRNQKQKIIFALNIHRTKDGQLKPTAPNLADARKIITEIYQKFYPNTIPPIVEIDSLTGTGISQITEFICQILPSEKIGNMQQVLKDELKEFAKKERSYRYRQTLIYIASRLATERVDTPLGKGILNEAYAAVCDYGISIFLEEDARAEMEKELYELVDEVAAQTKTSRAKDIETMVDVVEYKKEIEEIIAGWDQEYEDMEVEVPELGLIEKTQSRVETVDAGRSAGRIVGGTAVGALAGLGGFTAILAGIAATGATIATGGLAAPLAAAVIAGAVTGGAMGGNKQTKQITVNEDVIEPVVKKVTKIERRLAGMKARKEKVTKNVPYTVQKLKKVGEEFIQGGYPVVENLLAIGLGIESANSSTDGQNDFNFEDAVKLGQQQVQANLSRYRDKINQLAESNNPDLAEAQIIKILESALLK